jgi:hypothetical protein
MKKPGMDKQSIIKELKKTISPKDAARLEALARLEAALAIPLAFEELAGELPPELRYLGPGAWMAALGKAAAKR